jgi:hypothetical protein
MGDSRSSITRGNDFSGHEIKVGCDTNTICDCVY